MLLKPCQSRHDGYRFALLAQQRNVGSRKQMLSPSTTGHGAKKQKISYAGAEGAANAAAGPLLGPLSNGTYHFKPTEDALFFFYFLFSSLWYIGNVIDRSK